MNTEYYMMLQKQRSPSQAQKGKTSQNFGEVSKNLQNISTANSQFSIEQRDQVSQRKNRYQRNWEFYNGNHWANPFYEGERKAVFNYCKTVVDKATTWFLAKGWSVKTKEGNGDIASICNQVWEDNERDELTMRLVQQGAIAGDSYLYLSVFTGNKDNPLPRDKWKIKLQALDPKMVFPVWSNEDPNRMEAVVIEFEISKGDTIVMRTLFIAKNYFQVWEDSEMLGEWENSLGEIPVVHFPNFPISNSHYGKSDIEDVIPVNEEYNAVANAIKRTINYHAEPTTIIYGAKASKLERGANKVWSGLPSDAKVENLSMDTDMEGTYRYLENLEKLIFKLGETPKVSFDSENMSTANTSGISMQMMFQPLIEKTRRRQRSYTPGFKRVNFLILRAKEVFFRENLEALADDPANLYETFIEYTSPLPKDEQRELDIATKKVEAGFWSKAEAIRRVSNVTDETTLALELAADRREKLANDFEKQKAMEMVKPNFNSVFLSSVYLSQDFEEVISDRESQ